LHNQLVLSGVVCKAPETRYNPAGIPLTRLSVEHRSRQIEAGLEREAYCRIVVIATGQELSKKAQALSQGQAVKVAGFISRADSRQGQAMLVLHAQALQGLASLDQE
jgi:primosomal replication protein N